MEISSILTTHFFKLSNSIFQYGLTLIQFVVYGYLVCCARSNEKCYPSMKNIAANCNCSPNAARQTIHTILTPLPLIEDGPRVVYTATPQGEKNKSTRHSTPS